jgi:hypothetical protein
MKGVRTSLTARQNIFLRGRGCPTVSEEVKLGFTSEECFRIGLGFVQCFWEIFRNVLDILRVFQVFVYSLFMGDLRFVWGSFGLDEFAVPLDT